jgi:peptide/nickel transport system substrate-binding protein
MNRGRMDRREFVRIAALLGVAAPMAYKMAGIQPAFAAMGDLPFAADDPNAKKGGILKVAMQVQKMEDPATFDWTQMSNQTRQTLEYLTMTGPDNVTRPMLAEKWQASDDLKTWTFTLRQGVLWHNGDEFNADDVVYNFTRWLDPAVASSNAGLFAAMVEEVDTGKKDDKGNAVKTKRMIEGAVEKIDDHTVRIHLSQPVLSIPENLYNYPTAIVHRSFQPPFSDNPIGTGPFTLAELSVGEKCILKRITKTSDGKDLNYWGGDVYLDEIHYFDFSSENQLPAFASGDVDSIYEFGVEQLEFAKALDGDIVATPTAQTLVCRMNVTKEPFTDKRVRQAVVKSVDNAHIMSLIYPEGAALGENHHVAPLHPEYFKLPPMRRDIEAAKKLLADAGHGGGIELTINVGNTDGPWHQAVAEAMRDQMQDAGIKLNVNVMPQSKYWEVWTSAPFSATSWTHRPLGTMVLSLAYRAGVAWNETGYNNPEWEAALNEAEATLDPEARALKMEPVEKILQDDAIMVQALWRPVYFITSKKVHNMTGHSTTYHQFNKVWVDQA